METTKRIVLATITMAIFTAVMVDATRAKAGQRQTPDSATAAETQARPGPGCLAVAESMFLRKRGAKFFRIAPCPRVRRRALHLSI